MAIEVRTLYVMGDYLYAVAGSALHRVDNGWLKTALGSIGTNAGKCWIRGDGTNLVIVDGTLGYYWLGGGVLSPISFPDSFAPSSLAFQDGYFIVSKTNSGRFYISGSYDPTTWDASDYATAEGLSDNIVSVYSLNRDLWLFGDRSIELWFNSGAADFPFERYQGGFIEVGCRSARSIASSDERIYWLDNELRVRMGAGVQTQIISTPQIDYQIAQLSDWENSVGFYYMQEGHAFYQLTIADKTLVYDQSTNYWHTRASTLSDSRHPAQCYAWFADKHVVGHYSNGKLLFLDLDEFTNDGEVMRKIRAAQTVHNDRKRVFHAALDVEFEAGVGNAACPDPTAILEWSDDDGHTWSNQHTTAIGASGAFTNRAIWRRLGQGRGRVYRVTVEDPVKVVILGAHLEGQPGKS